MRKLIQGGTVGAATRWCRRPDRRRGDRRRRVAGDVDAEVVDASGRYVLPGLIDNHTHMAMPFGGTRSIDDYDTGTRAAAAGGTTCIVDFVIQQEPGGLRSSLEEWQERGRRRARRLRLPRRDHERRRGDVRRHAGVEEEGICSFKVFLAYKGVLMVTDDLFFRVLETTRDLHAPTMVHCENGWAIDVLVERALAAGQTEPIYHAHTRPEVLEAEATHRSVRLAELAGANLFIVHVTCGLAADEIAEGQARGVRCPARPAFSTSRTRSTTWRAPTSRARRYVCSPPLREAPQPGAALDGAAPRRARERLDRPLPVQQRAEGARARRLLEDPERPRDDPAPAREALGPRRRDGRITPAELVELTSTAIARRFGLPRKGGSRRARTPTSSSSTRPRRSSSPRARRT